MKYVFFTVSILFTIASCNTKPDKPNVLLICIDDLRTDLGCYGVDKIHTPNMDKLANEGRLFNNHYVFMAACGPSRSSLLTSQRTYKWDYLGFMRRNIENNVEPQSSSLISLPQLFKNNSYRTICIGKVSHVPGGNMDDGWSEVFCPGSDTWKTNWGAEFAYAHGEYYNTIVFKNELDSILPRLPYERGASEDNDYPDALNAQKAISELMELKETNEPFFLAVGFYKPHLPFNAPEKYWEMYDNISVATPACPVPPENTMPELTLHNSYEPTTHYYWPPGAGNINENEGKILNQGYWASVSYVDAQIGKVLDALNETGLDKNTIVVLWSDHGWHLGDYGVWGKFTLHEQSLKSPLIIKMPDHKKKGESTDAIVETVDIYPTLSQLCGLTIPNNLRGQSFCEVLMNPNAKAREFAYSVVTRDSIVGHSVRNQKYRFTQWIDTKSGEDVLYELYDHETDPAESKNIAHLHKNKLAEFTKQIALVRIDP